MRPRPSAPGTSCSTWVDLEQVTLVPLPSPAASTVGATPQSVGGTVAGRTFATTTVLTAPSENGERQRVWVPLLDGTERVGVVAMSFDGAEVGRRTIEVCERYAHFVAMLVVTKGMYSDLFDVVRRRKPATIAAELAWSSPRRCCSPPTASASPVCWSRATTTAATPSTTRSTAGRCMWASLT